MFRLLFRPWQYRSRPKLSENFEGHWSIPWQICVNCPGRSLATFRRSYRPISTWSTQAPPTPNRFWPPFWPDLTWERVGPLQDRKTQQPSKIGQKDIKNTQKKRMSPHPFLGKFVWTNGPEISSKVSPPTLALVHGWLFPDIAQESLGMTEKGGGLLSLRGVAVTTEPPWPP